MNPDKLQRLRAAQAVFQEIEEAALAHERALVDRLVVEVNVRPIDSDALLSIASSISACRGLLSKIERDYRNALHEVNDDK